MSKHSMIVTIPHGDPDIGAELDCKITFGFTAGRPAVMYLRNGDPGYPADPAELEFLKAEPYCNGKPSPFYGAFADMEQSSLDALAESWLESDESHDAVMETILSDDEDARAYAAELRADR